MINTADRADASRLLGRYRLHIDDSLMLLDSVWCRTVYSDRESMLSPSAWHSAYELHYIMEGSVVMTVGDSEITLSEDEFIIIPPKEVHSTVGVSENCEKFVFAFDIQSRNESIKETLGEIGCRVCKKTVSDKRARTLIDMMLDEAKRCASTSEQALSGLCGLVLLAFFGEYSQKQSSPAVMMSVFESDKRINDIRNYISENISSHIDVGSVAKHLHLCIRHVNRIAKQSTGHTVTEMITEERLSHIKRLLRSEMSLSEIAEMSDFRSEYSLNRFFKKYEGESIGSWRRSIQK